MKTNLAKWMEGIEDSKPLFALNIAGTHDSVTQNVQYSHLTKCQSLSIFDQLTIGVRCLDLRVKPDGKALAMIHSIANAYNSKDYFRKHMDLADVLMQCYRFLEINPSEAIIIQFKNDNNKDMEQCFDNLAKQYIAKNKAKWFTADHVPTLGEARGKLVLLRRCSMNESNSDYSKESAGIDFSSWQEQDELVPDPLKLETNSADNAVFVIQDRYKYTAQPKWEECVKPFLDSCAEFDKEYKICYLSTAGGFKGPEKNAQLINEEFMNYPLVAGRYYGILYLDFPNPQLCEKIINTNY